MTKPLLIIYSNTDYMDVLNIATVFLKEYNNKILLIDNNIKKHNNFNILKEEYNDIIYYDNDTPYATRLLNLKNINDDFYIFMHETDILIKYDINELNNLIKFMKDQNIDKIELQHSIWYCNDIPLKQKYNLNNEEIKFNENCYLYKIDNPDHFVYNVNPTIWNNKSFMNIMNNFKEYNYRNIENYAVQEFVSKKKCYSLKCPKFYVKCGHFLCVPFFQFIHITHYGKWSNLKDKYYSTKEHTILNGTYLLDDKVYDIYINKIYNIYIKNSNRLMPKKFP